MDPRRAVREMSVRQTATALRRWARDSTLVTLLTDERLQQAVVGLVLLISTVSVLGSRMNAAVKFLSFVALFAVVAALVWSVADPFGPGSAVGDGVETDQTNE